MSDNNSAFDGFGTQTNRWVPGGTGSNTPTQPSRARRVILYDSKGNVQYPPDATWLCFGGPHAAGFNAVLLDGSVITIAFGVDPTVLNAYGVRNNKPVPQRVAPQLTARHSACTPGA